MLNAAGGSVALNTRANNSHNVPATPPNVIPPTAKSVTSSTAMPIASSGGGNTPARSTAIQNGDRRSGE